jgi:phosphoserine phosphatase
MDLVVRGGALPTFLLDRLVAATGAARVEPCPPQAVRLRDAHRTAEFGALLPLLAAERLDWAFVPAAP